jgi:hypothetical protein
MTYYADLIAMDNTILPTLQREQRLLTQLDETCTAQDFDVDEDQADALRWYAMTGFLYVNEALRAGRSAAGDPRSVHKRLMSIRPLLAPPKVVLWRGIALPDTCEHPAEGSDFIDPGFASCSVIRSFAESMTSRYVRRAERASRARYVLRIEVAAGSELIPAWWSLLRDQERRGYSRPCRTLNEAEVLLAPGSPLRVSQIRHRADGVHVVHCHLHPPQPAFCEAAA